MAIEATFRELSGQLQKLQDMLAALHATIGDRPENDGSALADDLENSVLDVMGALHETRKWSNLALQAADHPLDMDGVRRALSACQQNFHRIDDLFATELVSFEKLKGMTRLGNARRGEWKAWTNSIRQGTEQCQPPLRAVSKALSGCWQELAEHAAAPRVSVQTTNVGQRIVSRVSKPPNLHYEPIT